MDVNGGRFHLLLGLADWRRCSARPDETAAWQGLDGLDVAAAADLSPPPALAWDATRHELRLPAEPIEIGATPGEMPFGLDARRSAAADRYGNIYWIADARSGLRVWSVGSQDESAFWDAGIAADPAASGGRGDDFAPRTPASPAPARFGTLAVTDDHYLVVSFEDGAARGLLAFDLMAGGPPVRTLWPAAIAFEPWDMCPRHGGGIWLLDRHNQRLWELDRRLSVVSPVPGSQAPAETDLFQPPAGPLHTRVASSFPGGIDLAAQLPGIDAIAVDALGSDGVLLLDAGAGASRVHWLRRSRDQLTLATPLRLPQAAQDIVVAGATARDAAGAATQLLVAAADGNQALAYAIDREGGGLALRASATLFPLRRFGGRALLSVRGKATYDSGVGTLRWVPVVQQPRARYTPGGELLSPVFDGQQLQCPWSRLLLDAGIAAGTLVEVWARASDEPPGAGEGLDMAGAWQTQPALYLRGDGAELPWLRAAAARATQRDSGRGTWEVLLQDVRGRYLQLRLRLSSHGSATPWLHALRVWYPRLSYLQRYLPAVYREEPVAASFLDRMLANMEGVNTVLEGRIAQVQALFDPAIAPAGALDWLAQWFDLALDPKWEEWRRRMLIRRAMDFFQWRGTVHGLRLALALATDPCLDESAFDAPDPDCSCPSSIRIVETYLTRNIGALAAGDPGAAAGAPGPVVRAALWAPAEGNAGLVERLAKWQSRSAGTAEQIAAFALFPPFDAALSADENQQRQVRWNSFAQQNLGFVPGAGEAERARWQNWLLVRYASVSAVNEKFATHFSGLGDIDVPADWPTNAGRAADWQAYCALADDSRNRPRWVDFLTRRYRRIERLNSAHQTHWPSFDVVALPDHLPETPAAQTDWLQFERQLLAMFRTAHRFSVLLPVASVNEDPFELDRKLQLVRRIVELEKPAHTVFDVRYYWALNRIGEARLGLDTLLDQGSRAPQLLPFSVLGRSYLGASFVGGPPAPTQGERRLLAC